MSIILGKKIGLEKLIGGGKTPPENWEYLVHHLTNEGISEWTFTAEQTGWYRFYLVGPGGAGGGIGGSVQTGYNYINFPPSGGGGGAGGYGVHDCYLKAGKTVAVTLGPQGVSAAFEEGTVSVTAGDSGGTASGSPGTGGSGGSAAGKNVCNIEGSVGKSGGGKVYTSWDGSSSSQTVYGAAGGVGGIASGHKYYTQADAPVSETLGRGGAGAGRWIGWHEYDSDTDKYKYLVGTRPAPESGSPGGIVIEKGSGSTGGAAGTGGKGGEKAADIK